MASIRPERPLGSHSSGLVPGSSFGPIRTLVLGLSKLLFASLSAASVSAAPLSASGSSSHGRHGLAAREHLDGDDPDSRADIWVLYVASIVLVLLGGAFAGLTIALMGQDSIYLQVLSRDETDPQQKNARRVYELLQRGKHWVLVTLLLSNVIVNETLPVVLDRCLGGGVAAVVGSTLLIVVFGEVLPQSVCVRYGLQIGGFMAKPVLALMWLMAPVAWPTAKVLDHALGEDHGTVYKKSGLKTLVTLHRSLGEVSERLTQDEVTIISAVLDLKEKPVSSVMTPMDDVFTMSEDTVLDEEMMDMILSAGYSRIPIHERGNPTNFVGMLLVKILITYDPDDNRRVSEFPLATLPETRPETSCLDIVNFFQEGKSHMVIVSQYPGEDYGALGVVTLEDVIEELIGEEIIDESDVYIDVHKAIRRLQPAPRARLVRSQIPRTEQEGISAILDEISQSKAGSQHGQQQQHQTDSATGDVDPQILSSSPKLTTVMMHRRSAGADGRVTQSTVPVRANIDEMWQHLRHLGPSNPATNPKNTRSTTVKIKTAMASATPRDISTPQGAVIQTAAGDESHHNAEEADEDVEADETTCLLGPKAVASLDGAGSPPKQDYGSAEPAAAARSALSALSDTSTAMAGHSRDESTTITESVVETVQHSKSAKSGKQTLIPGLSSDGSKGDVDLSGNVADALAAVPAVAPVFTASNGSDSGSSKNGALLNVTDHTTITTRHGIVRSGSITENVVETRGIRKVVLETNSSADEEDDLASASLRHHHTPSKLHSRLLASSQSADEGAKEHEQHAPEQTDSDKEPAASASASSPAEAAPEAAAASGGAGKKKTRRKKRKGGSSGK